MNKNIKSNSQWVDYYLDKYYLQRTEALKKKAAKMEDILSLMELSESLQTAGSIGWQDVENIRNVLGNIMRNVNDISRVYRMGSFGYDVKERAIELLPDVKNFSDLRQAAMEVMSRLRVINISPNENEKMIRRSIMQIMTMLQSITFMQFTPEQIQTFQQMASGAFVSKTPYTGGVNIKRLEAFLKGSIYSSKNDYENVIKVIRETLQNAVDATFAVKREKPEHKPEVRLYTTFYGDYGNKYMDLTVVDNGTGMDMDTLTKKFYDYFETGKEEEEESAGGFGIAKAVIQETPLEGWSLETNESGSSSFHKNMFTGEKMQNQLQNTFQHPTLTSRRNGTQLNLYHIPQLDIANIKNICSKYSTGEIDIYLNDELITPEFNFSDMHRIDASGAGIMAAIASNEVEQELAKKIITDKQETLKANNVGGYEWSFKGPNGEDQYIKASFYLMKVKNGSYGRFFVRLNGQYQNESGFIEQCNIICEIQTNIRPNEEYYPMDPGRENLRSPVKETVQTALETIKELIKDITQNEIFKEGLDIYIYNKDKKPMSTDELDSWEKRERKNNFLERMNAVGVADTKLFERTEAPASEVAAVLQQAATLHPEMTERQQTMLGNVAEALGKERDAINTQTFLDDIIEILETPCEVTVQKGFVTDAVAHDDIELTSVLAVLWQKVLKIIIKGSRSVAHGRSREFIPGLVYSDKAIALYSSRNPRVGREYDTISINPMFVASIVNPDLFDDYLAGKISEEHEGGRKSIEKNETPINRLSVFLFHEAIHEVTHLLFRDSYSGYDEFHTWVSKMENINHYRFNLVRDEVKRYMPQLKRDTDKLIRRIKKDHKRSGKDVATPE